MGNFTFHKTEIEGVFVIEPRVFGDHRGYFMETYKDSDFKEGGIECTFVQDNQSKSKKGVLRGLHFQKTHPQSKLVRVIKGEVYDVAVDLREGSPTFGKHVGVILSKKTKNSFLSPRALPTDFWFSPKKLSSATNAMMYITPRMRAVCSTAILLSAFSGPRQAMCSSATRTRSILHLRILISPSKTFDKRSIYL